MKFGVYEIFKPIFTKLLNNAAAAADAPHPAAFLLSSIVAGAIAAMLLCPMESTRIRIVTDPAYADAGLLQGLSRLVTQEGLWSTLSSGLWAMLAKQVPYTFGKQVSFDVFAGWLYAALQQQQQPNAAEDGGQLLLSLNERQRKWVVSVAAAFGASLVACIFSQPGDMILTETYRRHKKTTTAASTTTTSTKKRLPSKKKKQPPPAPAPAPALANDTSNALPAVVQRIYQERGGLPGFFTGTGARIVHVGLIITSQLVIYDIVKQLLGLPATGSH